MKAEKYPLSSEQMELLLGFEIAGSLEKLADLLAKDPSVISRNLKKLADEWPVLVKSSGRWQITPLGRQVNVLSREFLAELHKLTDHIRQKQWDTPSFRVPPKSLLVVVNAQKALQDPARGRRNNSDAEKNIQKILAYWRKKRWPVIYAKHISENPSSFFHVDSSGVDFIPSLEPREGEIVLEKKKPSAFFGTKLKEYAEALKAETIVLTGFTAGDCIDATARQGHELGFRVVIVSDATATFDIRGPNGRIHRAEKIHKGTLAVLHSLFAEISDTDKLCNR